MNYKFKKRNQLAMILFFENIIPLFSINYVFFLIQNTNINVITFIKIEAQNPLQKPYFRKKNSTNQFNLYHLCSKKLQNT